MTRQEYIPIHDFSRDDKHSIPFRFIHLGALASYDYSQPHRHNYYEIFFFLKGGGTHLIDFREYAIADHSIHFVSPGQVHRIRRSADSLGSLILFSRDFYYMGMNKALALFDFPFLNPNLSPVLNITETEYAGFTDILLQVGKEADNETTHSDILRSYLNIVLLKCLHVFNTRHGDKAAGPHSTFYDFRNLVENEYRTQRQPAYYADKLNITEKKLNEVCKACCGENVSEFIKQRVLLEAKRLLFNSDHSIKEIAYFLGFEDPSYFNRFFKTSTGVTAGDFRDSGK